MSKQYAKIKSTVRTFGGKIWEVADAEVEFVDGLLLIDPNDGSYLYFMNNEVDLL